MRRWLPQSQFGRDVATLLGGTAAATAIPLLAQPILSRYYEPKHWGPQGLFEAVFSILSIIATARYEQGIVLPSEDHQGAALFRLSARFTIGFTVLVSLVCAVLYFFREGPFRLWIPWVPVAVLATGLYQTLTFWCIRMRAFGLLAQSRMLRQLFVVLLWIAGGLLHRGASGLVIGLAVGQLLGTLVLAFQVWREHHLLFKGSSFQAEREVAVRYSDFPLYSLASGLLNTVAQGLPRFLLYRTFGEAGAGDFTFAQKTAVAPISALGGTFADVFKQRAADEQARTGTCYESWRTTFIRLLKLAAVPALILTVAAPLIYGSVFGHSYVGAGRIAQILGPYTFLMFLASPLSRTIIVTEHQKEDLYWQIGLLLTTGASLAYGCAQKNLVLGVGLFAGSYALMYVIYLVMSRRFALAGRSR